MAVKRLGRIVFILLLFLAYLPAVFVPMLSRSSTSISGIPLLWVYMLFWVLYAYGLLVVAYIVDKKMGW